MEKTAESFLFLFTSSVLTFEHFPCIWIEISVLEVSESYLHKQKKWLRKQKCDQRRVKSCVCWFAGRVEYQKRSWISLTSSYTWLCFLRLYLAEQIIFFALLKADFEISILSKIASINSCLLWLLKWCKIQSFLICMFSLVLFVFSLILYVFSLIL